MSDYYILITDAGAALEAAAHAAGTTVELAEFGVCDGGVTFIPDPAATTFPNEVFRGAISALSVSEDDAATLEAQCVIPGTSGGYVIRGLALYAADGTLYATGNYPDQSKPEPESGYAASLEILAQLAVSDTADITLTVTEGEFLTEEEADSLYLRQDKNLSEIAAAGATAQSEARDNLGLKSAATHDVTTSHYDLTQGHVLQVGDYGWGTAAGLTLLESIFDITCTAKYAALGAGAGDSATEGMPENSGNTRFSVDADSIYTNQYWVTLRSSNQAYTGMLNTSNKTIIWTQIYTTEYKPTASDTGALPITGGDLTGILTIEQDGRAITLKPDAADAAVFMLLQDHDGSNICYVGKGTSGVDDVAFSNYKGGGNDIILKGDGAITITCANGKNLNVTGEVIPSKYDNFDARYISNLQLGAQVSVARDSNGYNKGAAGYVMMGTYSTYQDSNWEVDNILCKPIQKYINGTWVTISG